MKTWIAFLAITGIVVHLVLRFGLHAATGIYNTALVVALVLGGTPLVLELLLKLFRREFGSDLLAGISIVTSVALSQYLAGTLVVLMLSGGEALEEYAVRSASSVLQACFVCRGFTVGTNRRWGHDCGLSARHLSRGRCRPRGSRRDG